MLSNTDSRNRREWAIQELFDITFLFCAMIFLIVKVGTRSESEERESEEHKQKQKNRSHHWSVRCSWRSRSCTIGECWEIAGKTTEEEKTDKRVLVDEGEEDVEVDVEDVEEDEEDDGIGGGGVFIK
jgi:hypothetical protein